MINSTGVVEERAVHTPFGARGPLSAALLDLLSGQPDDSDDFGPLLEIARSAAGSSASVVRDEDIQLALFLLYGLHYGSLPGVSDAWEWQPGLVRVRGELERAFERELRESVALPDLPQATRAAVARTLSEMTSAEAGPSLSRFLAKKASEEQAREFLIQRSIYTLREADPHSWAIPRLTGRSKAALVEIQADEYGGGRPARMHSAIFAETMRGAGLDTEYAHYLDRVPAITLASLNTMSLFGLNRRLRGAIVGHLAAFEMTSSIPNLMYGNGFRRLGYGTEVTAYFDEHVAADAVHEQIAANDLAGALAEDEPALVEDILFGAGACLLVDGWASAHMLEAFTDGVSSLRTAESAGQGADRA
ncbi:iron-containing redox enzyme family protein [Conyzicola sp.]|uniref:iron-containing redox enzyme family protein n=1 Tax=Conyzicola sp. TaxID=1969404 RepID=UPI0039895ADF